MNIQDRTLNFLSILSICIFATTTCHAYFPHIPLTKAAAAERKYDVEITFQDFDDLLFVTITVPRFDRNMVFTGSSVKLIDKEGMTLIISDLLEKPAPNDKVSFSFRLASREITNTAIGITYRQSPAGGNGWQYQIDLKSFYEDRAATENAEVEGADGQSATAVSSKP